MDALERLRKEILQSPSPLLRPQPLAHSQELEDQLPLMRRHVGPRAWYECLEPPGRPEKQ